MTTDARLRSLSLINFDEMPHLRFHIVGMGAVGSRVFEQLVSLGCRNIHCYDFDKVEAHNLHNQLWIAADIGQQKIKAARNWVQDKYSIDPDDYDLKFFNMKVGTVDAMHMDGIIMLCLDSFEGRRAVVEGASHSDGKVLQVFEGRCAPSFIEMRSIDPSDQQQVKEFNASLGSDDDPEAYLQICGLPISFAPIMGLCGISMVMQAINFIKQGELWEDQRKIHFISSPMLVLGADQL